jgi:hypothetical protein
LRRSGKRIATSPGLSKVLHGDSKSALHACYNNKIDSYTWLASKCPTNIFFYVF